MNSILRLAAFALAMVVSISSAYEAHVEEADEAFEYDAGEVIEKKAELYEDQNLDPDFDADLDYSDLDPDLEGRRKLDTSFTVEPTPKPTKKPTAKPTKSPTLGSCRTPPTTPDVCGTIEKTDGSGLLLGPYDRPSWCRDEKYFDCNNNHVGDWWHRGMYKPEYKYNFRVSKTCKYLYRAPENDFSWEETRDVNSWLEQMVILTTRPGHTAYRISDEDIIFKGYDDFPTLNNVLDYRMIDNCPEAYCVKIFGNFLTRRDLSTDDETDSPTMAPTPTDIDVRQVSVNPRGDQLPLGRCEGDCDRDSECAPGLICHQREKGDPLPVGCTSSRGIDKLGYWDFCAPPSGDYTGLEIMWAFSNEQQHWDFYHNLRHMFSSQYKERIFGTNHFLRCGCESFCMENSNKDFAIDPVGGGGVVNGPGATCYVEEKCGTRVFMVKYPDNYMGTKVSWADEGTTNVMDWFSECANAMYGCTEFTNFDTNTFEIPKGGYWKHYHAFPKLYQHDALDITDYALPRFKNLGVNPPQVLGMCEGDCDHDSQCAEGLLCMQRNGHEPVPGCNMGAIKGWDYCYDPNFGNANPLAVATRVGNNWVPAGVFPLGECQGDCDRDSDCQEGLVCHQRNYKQPIPGCVGSTLNGNDYCVKKEYVDAFKATGETGWVDVVVDPSDSVTVNWTYGFGGDRYYGFKDNIWVKDTPMMEWTCPSRALREELSLFGEYVANAELFRYAQLDQEVPSSPCKEEEFLEPEYPPEVIPFLDCDDISPTPVYCFHDTQATCYAHKTEADCGDIVFTVQNATGTRVYDDVAKWHDACLENMQCHRVPQWAHMDGNLTKTGMPRPIPHFSRHIAWELLLGNKKYDDGWAITGNKRMMWYNCSNWIQTYKSRNFTMGAGDYYDMYGNTYGDLYAAKECTERPSSSPSLAPSVSAAPTETPSMNPTFCSESYLTSEDLNIALVIDLSFSTYETEFSAEHPVGDVNGDGKGNTILDAQVVAVEELLGSIAKSEQLNNANCEIQLISFSTDAKSHGKWRPLSGSNDAPNEDLMKYIKKNLRAPTSNEEVKKTNNGYTNFDAALDVTVDYFNKTATPGRKDLLVFLSDGIPNVRGDGDNEGYCTDTVKFWKDQTFHKCSDLNIAPGVAHDFCRGDDAACVNTNVYQDCVRGPNACTNKDAVTQYDSEIAALTKLGVERLAIGVGAASDVSEGSALWTIDNNPAKYKGVLPLQALNLDELSEYLGSLCILNTDPPTTSPSASPSASPSLSMVPSSSPSSAPSGNPSASPSMAPSASPSSAPTDTPSASPSSSPSSSPTAKPSSSPTTKPSSSPTTKPSSSPSTDPSASPVHDLDRHGDDDDDRDVELPEPGCPEDIILEFQSGETEFPLDAVRIVSQDTASVTVQIHQTFTDGESSLDGLYYQYKYDPFNSKCYEQLNLEHGNAVEFTISCMIGNHVGALHFWAADDDRKGFINANDSAAIPACCSPTVPSATPVVEYVLSIRCVPGCPSKSDTFTCSSDARCQQEEVHNSVFLRGGSR